MSRACTVTKKEHALSICCSHGVPVDGCLGCIEHMMMHDEASKAAMRAQARHEKTQTPEEKALADQAARTLTVALRAVEDTMHAVSELSVGREGLDVLAATANHFAEASEASARVAQIVDRIADKLFVR